MKVGWSSWSLLSPKLENRMRQWFKRQHLHARPKGLKVSLAVCWGTGTASRESTHSPSLWPRCYSRRPAPQAPCSTCPLHSPVGKIRKSWNSSSGSSSVARTVGVTFQPENTAVSWSQKTEGAAHPYLNYKIVCASLSLAVSCIFHPLVC